MEGGWAVKNDEDEESGDDKKSDDDTENKMVRDILNSSNEKKETKETLVEELDLTEEGDESKKKINEPDAEDDGEVKNAEEGVQGKISESQETKLPGLVEEKKEPEGPKNDWSLLD